jgi:hypothetical protein
MRSNQHFVIPGLGDSREPGTQGQTHSSTTPWVPDRASRVRNDERKGWRKGALAIALLTLAACASSPGPAPLPGEPGPGNTPPPIPLDGPIAYRCSDGTQLMVEANGQNARVAIVGGPSMVLPNAGGDYYSNGRYGFRGGGASGQWEVGRSAPVSCSGS